MLEGVEPLGRQFGLHPRKTVPDELRDALFGQPEPGLAGTEAVGDDPRAALPMRTYAILDASKAAGLPELLETSGLEYRCLFKGDAYDELKDVAPWIVRLEEDGDFTRRLFTGPAGVNGLWDKEPGLYIRSRATLDELWRHFRKFTRVQDEGGKWFYQRFWEPHALPAYTEHGANPFLHDDISSVVAVAADIARIARPAGLPPDIGSPVMTRRERDIHAEIAAHRTASQLARKLFTAAPGQMSRLRIDDPGPMKAAFVPLGNTLARYGITRAADVARICACALFYGTHFLRDPRIEPHARMYLGHGSRSPSLRVLRFEESLRNMPRHQILTTDAGLRDLGIDLDRLQETGNLPPIPVEYSGLNTPRLRSDFHAACELGWRRSGLPPGETSLRRLAHTRIAVLWTPYFLEDPLHARLKDIFLQARHDDVAGLVQELRQRTEKA